MATINIEPLNNFYSENQCQTIGDKCQQNTDCCSNLICYSISKQNLCLPFDKRMKRYSDDFIIPPYYNPQNYLYPYGINMPPFPFYNAYGTKQSEIQPRNKKEWDNCQFHEDCGENNCCYVHFRFRSLPKSFCRPNRNNKSKLCEPLTKYRSLKDVPAWKQQQQQQKQQSKQAQQQQQQKQQPFPLRISYFGQ
ncbi:unnamed protein product [Adineta steineri]|uniref:Uncharacterized protein n=1 Tax=Adineta steineri TaxID=433720 RepID=A0A813MMZ7_9BILA|nr:unnamed protein product [Adineta steineri]CAF4025410.1 unnamed protein product [Adineta steineri]